MTFQKNSKTRLIFLFIPIPFLFYWYTCLPSIGLGDSVLFIHAIKQLKFSTWVNSHNLTTLWGWIVQLIPFGDFAYRGNLSCVLTSSFAICIFYFAVYSNFNCFFTALISATFMMISQSMWWHATDLADYSMNSVFVTIAIYLYVQLYKTNLSKYLYSLFFLSGLAIFQHYLLGSLLIGTTATLFAKIFRKEEKIWPIVSKSAIFFLIGLIPWLLTFLHDVSVSHSVSETLSGCLGGPFKKLFFGRPFWDGLVEYLILIFIQFPSLYLIPVILGPFFFVKSWKFNVSTIGIFFSLIPIIYFELGLDTWALFAQYLSTFIILAFCASFVIHKTVHYLNNRKSVILNIFFIGIIASSVAWTIYFYSHLSRWGEDPNNIWYVRFNNSYTFNYYRLNEFLANPNKRNYQDISKVCNLLLKKLPRGAEYWDNDSRLFFQLKEYYQQYYHKRTDLHFSLINSFGFKNWGADENTFIQKIKKAYLNGKDLFLSSKGHPFNSLLVKLPSTYQFRKFYLSNNLWVYKLVTIKDKKLQEEQTQWERWDFLPSNKKILVNLTLDNLLDFHEGNILLQQDMSLYGNSWKNDDQVFFSPSEIGSEIGFLLRFNRSFKGTLAINLTVSFDSGEVEVSLNNRILSKEPLDLYIKGISVKKFEFPQVTFDKGNNILTLKVIGKNIASNDKKLGIDTIEITPQS